MSETLSNVELDARSRNRIISEMDQNFFVEAGAGSGKTTMLVNRMTAMVEAGVDISKICAITFTKAAAGEFYARFQRMLIERSNPDFPWEDHGFAGQLPKPTEESRERCRNALQNIDLCFMGTIDSFCFMILSEHPSEAKIPSDSMIIEEEELKAFYHQIYIRISEGYYGQELQDLSKLFRSMNTFGEHDVFQTTVPFLMGNRNALLHYRDVRSVDVDDLFKEDRKALLGALRTVLDHPALVNAENKGSVEAWETLPDVRRILNRTWSTNFSSVMNAVKKVKGLRLKTEAMDQYGVSLADVFQKKGKRKSWLACEDWIADLSSRMRDLQYAVSMTFMNACVPIIEEELKKKGYLSFFDDLLYLRDMLKKDAESEGKLIRYIYDRHSYFLIDEFQDTDPLQAQIFFYLSAENPVPKWYECTPRPGSLFIVGDPKQSIYRFKGADVSSFLNVRSLMEKTGGAVLKLCCNFRSRTPLLEYFNRVFGLMLPEDTDIQSKYDEIPVVIPAKDEFQGIYRYYIPSTSEIKKGAEPKDDPSVISRLIQTLHDNENYTIPDQSGKKRRLSYSDFMVITSSKKELAPIMRVLDEAGIPMRVEGSVQFNENEALMELLNIYKAIADPSDKIALYGALHGKILGITDYELSAYEDLYHFFSIYPPEMNEKESEQAKHVRTTLVKMNGFYRKSQQLSPSGLFSLLMEELELFRYVSAENLEVLYYTLELLRKAETSGTVISPKDGSRYLSALADETRKEERCLRLTDREDCVHMANLHKVKGLEAPVVIIASKGNRKNPPASRVEHSFDGSDAYIFKVGKPGSLITYLQTYEFAEEEEAEKAVSEAEQKRLAYVAATRARNVLIIGDRKSSKWKELMDDQMIDAELSLLSKKKQEESEQPDIPEEVSIGDLYESAKKECILAKAREAETVSFELCNPSKESHPVKMEAEPQPEDVQEVIPENIPDVISEEEPEAGPRADGALLGTLVHRMMELLVSGRNQMDGKQMIAQILSEYRTPSTELLEKDLKEKLSSVLDTIRQGGYPQTNGQPQDILSILLNAEEVYCEMPFSYQSGKELWNGVMDAVYYADGKWHIIDYKTNADGRDLDQRYQKQLNAYKEAFRIICGKEADAGTYHIDI